MKLARVVTDGVEVKDVFVEVEGTWANHIFPYRPADCQRCHTRTCKNKQCPRCEIIPAGGRS